MWPTREEAWKVLNEYTKNPNLIKHALAVEAGMRAYAKRLGEDEEKWAVVGLIHDFEYEKYPDLGPEVIRSKARRLCARWAGMRHSSAPSPRTPPNSPARRWTRRWRRPSSPSTS